MPAHPNRYNVRVVRKAGTALLAVYDENGKLVGMVDPALVQAVAAPPPPKQASSTATPVQRVAANLRSSTLGPDGKPVGGPPGRDQAADDIEAIAKALDGARFSPELCRDGLVNVAKATGNGDTFDVVLKSVDATTAGRLTDAVALSAMRIATAHGVPVGRAVKIAKQAAIKLANAKATSSPSSSADVIGQIARRLTR